ncbi:MAG TPA: methyltransferase domain-containing protein [Candidatus Dormibacteraeota bacterium]|jgi:SAM-dependent methyltransferase|nr:methyltransferase domain-containing protein [Candidatus Dormibacteraeota bacterium]
MDDIDWAERWRRVVEDRATLASGHADSGYWDRRAASYARSTRTRVDEFLQVLEPFLSPRKTLIDVGAGAGRHTEPLSWRLEWVTAVEPSEGMRSRIPPRDNITVIASAWEDAVVAPADLVICSHVMYGVAEPVPFLEKMNRSARERVFVMIRESELPHPAARLRTELHGHSGPRLPRFSELFMLLVQMGMAPDVSFIRYDVQNRYSDMDEAVADSRALFGDGWDDARGRAALERLLRRDGDDLVFDGGTVLSGVAHWKPTSS